MQQTEIDIQDIIKQLTQVSPDDDKLNPRGESIKNLTPIEKVYKAGSIYDIPNSFTVSKYRPKIVTKTTNTQTIIFPKIGIKGPRPI